MLPHKFIKHICNMDGKETLVLRTSVTILTKVCSIKHLTHWYAEFLLTINSVFHRILDFKTGLDFYPGPLLFLSVNLPSTL